MRFTLMLFVGTLCLAFSYAIALDDDTAQNDKVIDLPNLAEQGAQHANEGVRVTRAFFGFGRGYCCGGGYGRGGYGRGGYGFGGYGRGGYGFGGYGRGGYGRGGYGRRGYGRGGYGRYYGR